MARWLFLVLLVLSSTLSAQSLRVGVAAHHPPLVYRDGNELVGIEVDNARAVGVMLNLKMQLIEMSDDQLLPALAAGELDVVMSGLVVPAEEAQTVTYLQPYLRTGQMAITHVDNAARFAQPWSIYRKGLRVGVQAGTAGARFAGSELTDAAVRVYSDSTVAFNGLREGDIDLYVHDAATSWRLATSDGSEDLIALYAPLTEELLAWAVRSGDDILAEDLNRALRAMKSNGTLNYILNRWVPVAADIP